MRFCAAMLVWIFVLLFPCSGQAAPNPSPASEKAEDVLLRAHRYHADAIVRVIAGYGSGTNGFHKDAYLARAWVPPLLAVQAKSDYAVAALYVDSISSRIFEDIGRSLAHCEMARNSAAADDMNRLNFFDTESVCKEIEARKTHSGNWKDGYESAVSLYAAMDREITKFSGLARELIHRGATPDEQAAIEKILDSGIASPHAFAYFLAVSGAQDSKSVDWDVEPLISFVVSQSGVVRGGEAGRGFSSLVSSVSSLILGDAVSHGAISLQELIRNAHAGDYAAMGALAACYKHGISGFPHDARLARGWHHSAALEGDPVAMLMTALDYLEAGNLIPAWAFAEVVEKLDGADARLQALASQLKKTVESQSGDKERVQQRGEAMVLDFFARSEQRMDWREQHEESAAPK